MIPAFAVARLTDDARVGELHALVTGAFGALAIVPPSSVLRETVEDFRRRLARETALVAQTPDRALLGGVFCAPTDEALYIGRLAVRADVRRSGVASALLDASKDEARRRGFRKVTLSARIALAGNVALFLRHGFVVTAATAHAGFAHPTSYDMELQLG